MRTLRSNYGKSYDEGRGAFSSYCGANHWENRERWQKSAQGVLEAWHEYFGPRQPGFVLELGCGTGAMTACLGELGVKALGIDWGGNIRERACVVADVLAIPFPKADLVVALDVIEHVPGDLQPPLFEELRRIAGAALLVTVPSVWPFYYLDTKSGPRNHYLCGSPSDWASHFNEFGFSVISSGEQLARLGIPFAWGDENYPFLLEPHEGGSMISVRLTAKTCDQMYAKSTDVPLLRRIVSKGEVIELDDELAERAIASGLMEKATKDAGWNKSKKEKT